MENCGYIEFGHHGFDGRLKSRLELKRDVVESRLAKKLETDVSFEAAEPVVMAASQVWIDVQLDRRRQERQVAVVIEHGQTSTRIDERLGRHLSNQRKMTITVLQRVQLLQTDRIAFDVLSTSTKHFRGPFT